jgi:Ca2+-binding RTX toxin-like protein
MSRRSCGFPGGNRGDNRIAGTPGQPNALDGREGNDTLIGGNKGDLYAFTAGYGFDRIEERPDAPGEIDRVIFGASVRWEDVKFRRDGNDLLLILAADKMC